MKPIWHILLFTLLCSFAQASELLNFSAQVEEEESVLLQWEVDEISSLSGFILHRSVDNTHFQPICQMIPIDGTVYDFVDRPGVAGSSTHEKGLHFADLEQQYYYHLFAVLQNGDHVRLSQDALLVNFEMSTVSVTWGSIKAMFR